MLRAKPPEPKNKRLKMFVYGDSNIGKTTAAIQFPKSYIIDTERGTDHYSKTINKNKSVVFQTNVFDEATQEVKALLTEKHDYRTLVIDPMTQLYNAAQEKWSRVFEKYAKSEKEAAIQDFGMRYWGRIKSDMKALQRMLTTIDMNLIVTAHQKDLYGPGMTKIGVTFDSMKGDNYMFDFIFRLEIKNGKRIAVKIKERVEIGEDLFPPEFEWSYENFQHFYGKEMLEKESSPIALTTGEQLIKIKKLLEVIRIEDVVIAKWFAKADVESWEEMPAADTAKCIAFVEKQLPNTKEK